MRGGIKYDRVGGCGLLWLAVAVWLVAGWVGCLVGWKADFGFCEFDVFV